jgi:Domain of unknown function (DUF5597)
MIGLHRLLYAGQSLLMICVMRILAGRRGATMKAGKFHSRNRQIGKQKPEQILTAEEGYYTPAGTPGATEVWHVRRVLNGDETDRGIRFPDPPAQPPNASGDRAPPASAPALPMAVRIVLGRF